MPADRRYFILARARSDINNMLSELSPPDRQVNEIAHALQVRSAGRARGRPDPPAPRWPG